MALVDQLAENLSVMTGTKFTILRGRPPVRYGGPVVNKRPPMQYFLKADREDCAYTFGGGRGRSHADMTRMLASICDMVNMGYIPVRRPDGDIRK